VTTDVQLERTFDAAPERIYRAWLEPRLLQHWMAPGEITTTRVEVDEQVGGRYRIWHAQDGADAGGFDCELVELVPNERITWRWGFVGPQRQDGPRFDSQLTVTLRPAADGGTLLTLLHTRLDSLAAELPQVAGNVETGWKSALHKLAELSA
jgi:uncharacterized protein YndB with AHSA1/START domain